MTSISSLLQPSALSGVQSYQQPPSTIQALLAQSGAQTPADQPQQDVSQLDPQQLSDLIQSLQQNGELPPDPSQQDVQSAANDTMSSGSSQDSVVGASGDNTISGGDSQNAPSSINDILNNFSAGKGNVDYQGLRDAYPTPQSPLNNMSPDQLRAVAESQNQPHPGESGASTLIRQGIAAQALGAAQDVAQKNAMAQALNSRDVNAYNSMTGMAEKEGTIQDALARVKEEGVRDQNTASFQQGELGIRGAELAQGRYKPLGMTPDGHAIMYDSKTGTTIDGGVVNTDLRADRANGGIAAAAKPLDAAKQSQISKSLSDLLSTRDEDGKVTGSIPLDSTQKLTIAAAAGKLYQAGKAATAADAVGQVVGSLGGIDALADQTVPRTGIMSILGDKSTGMKAFPAASISQLAGTGSTSPAATGTAITAAQGGGSAIDSLVEKFEQTHPSATDDQVAKVRAGLIAMQQKSGQ